MNNEILNKIKLLIANGNFELEKANDSIKIGFDGKARTCARRAAGFFIQAFLTLNEKENYGKSFMNNLKSLKDDSSMPTSIRNSASLLSEHISDFELSGEKAILEANNIIDFIKKEYLKIN